MRRLYLRLFLLILTIGVAAVGYSFRHSDEDDQDGPQASGQHSQRSARNDPALPAAGIQFRDVAAADGLRYRWVVSGRRPLNILGTIGNGCAFLDYNNDGNLDILLVGPKLALYQGDGHGHFTDVTHATGLDKLHGHFLGCSVGDYDNDGYDDLYLSGYQTGILLHNEANLTPPGSPRDPLRGRRGEFKSSPFPGSAASVLGTRRRQERRVGGRGLGQRVFRDVTKQMGLEAQPWGTSCAFADVDGDGYLDLFVCNYVRFGPGSPRLCLRDGIVTACDPRHYPSLKGVLYHNLGGKRFEQVTHAWGIDAQTGNALGVACADIDGSGRLSLAIANDEPGDDLFRNLGQGHFENISTRAGTSGDKEGNKHAGMGIDWGDYDNDGKLDFFVTTFEREAKCLYHNEGGGLFAEQSAVTGIQNAMMTYVSFGCKFVDVDNDGWLDLLVASGHVEDGVEQTHHGVTYRELVRLLYNTGSEGGRPVSFVNLRRGTGLEKLPPIVGRGLAVGDFDNDGRMDALVVDGEGAPLLLHNETRKAGHWIGFRLIGSGRSNRDAYGAVVTVDAGGRQLMRVCHADGSYLSSSDRRVHIGLGKAAALDSITIRWPDGKIQHLRHLKADRYVTLVENS